MQTSAQSYGVLVTGRAIGDIRVGTLAKDCAVGPCESSFFVGTENLQGHTTYGEPPYISEISSPNLRGTLLVLEFNNIVLGKRHPRASAFKLEILSWLDIFDSKTWRRTVVGCGV